MVNLAFADVPISVQCLYGANDAGGVDASAADRAVLDNIERAHPVLIQGGSQHVNERYAGPGLSPFCDQPLPALVVAVNELVSNAFLHGGDRGVLRIWHDHDSGCVRTAPGPPSACTCD